MVKIKLVEYGLANNYGTYIELNKELKKYPKLYNYILDHEKGHKKEFDLFYEFKIGLTIFPLILFVFSHPKTWIDFLPIQIRKGKIIYDLNLGILLFFIVILLVIIYFITF
jgi:hypothetical protein